MQANAPMQAKAIFADNMTTVLGDSNVKELVRQARATGIAIDYTYVMDVRKGVTNPSLEKSEQIVQLLRLLPGHDWLEHWMFFIPRYFASPSGNNSGNILQAGSGPGLAMSAGQFDAGRFDEMVAELLVTSCRLQFLSLNEQQFDQVQELARFIYQKQTEQPSREPVRGHPRPALSVLQA
jgi:hypothetical protein